MAIIKIVKGNKELTVPAGALKLYASAGWHKADNSLAHDDTDKNTKSTTQDSDLGEIPEPRTDLSDTENPEGDNLEDKGDDTNSTNDEDDVVYVDPEELLTRPLGELDFEELQIVAEYLGLDIEEMTTSKALRAAIKKVQK